MITDDDLMGLCTSKLSDDQLEVIAEIVVSHTHVPTALSLTQTEALLESKEGIYTLKKYIKADIKKAEQKGDKNHAEELKVIYHTFESLYAA